ATRGPPRRDPLALHDALPIWLGSGPPMGWPSARTRPALGRSSPAARCSSVDLPQPDGPTSATSSPVLNSLEKPSTTWSEPKLLRSEEHTSELQSRENLVCRLL